MQELRRLIKAGGVADGAGCRAAPGVVLLEGDQVVAAGAPEEVGAVDNVSIVDVQNAVVIPALVNAHCHLDLTHVGPQPYCGDFVAWIEQLRPARAANPDEIRASVAEGVALCRRGGVGLVGDIAGVGSLEPIKTLRRSGLSGVSFLEVFGLGDRQQAAIAAMTEAVLSLPSSADGVRLGLQPHAPYSAGLEVYRAAFESGVPVATHLAETPAEIEFTGSGTGPLKDMLKRFGVWDESIVASGLHPVDLLLSHAGEGRCAAAHLNYIDEDHLQPLAQSSIIPVYCPRASRYFGHGKAGSAPHRYRDMLAAGIDVALGTDSIVCLDTPDRISVLDDMRHLNARDTCDPVELLRMATINGAQALGFDAELFTLSAGPIVGLLAIPTDAAGDRDPLVAAMQTDAAPIWLVGGHDEPIR